MAQFGSNPMVEMILEHELHKRKRVKHGTVCMNAHRKKYTHASGGYVDHIAPELWREREVGEVSLTKAEARAARANAKAAKPKPKPKRKPRLKPRVASAEAILGHVFFHDKVEEYEGPRPDLSLQCGDKVQWRGQPAVVVGRAGERVRLCITQPDGKARFIYVKRSSL